MASCKKKGGGAGAATGISWNQVTDVVTRIPSIPVFKSVPPWTQMRRCNLADDGTVNAYYGDPAFRYDGSNGQVMVEVPKFYYKFDHSATVHSPSISRYKLSGYKVHPAFVKDGVEKPYFYIGAFEGSVYDVTANATEVNTIKVTAEPTSNGNLTITLDGNYGFTVAILDADSVEGVVDKIVAAGVKTDYQGVTWTPAKTASDTLTYTAGSAGLKTTLTMPTACGVTSTITKSVSGAGGYIKNDSAGVDFTATTGDKLSSIAGVKPVSGWNNPTATMTNFRVLANNRGEGWGLQTFGMVSAIQMLMVVEYASFYFQSVLSAGITNITDDALTNMGMNTGWTAGVGTGATDFGNATGQITKAHYKTAQNTYPFSYRGIENFYGNLWKWVDGLSIKGNNMPWVADHDFIDATFSHPYTDTGITLPASNGYGSNLAYGAALDYAYLPSAVAGANNTHLTDYYYQEIGDRAAFLGGAWAIGVDAGAFAWYLSLSAALVTRTVGCRLAFAP